MHKLSMLFSAKAFSYLILVRPGQTTKRVQMFLTTSKLEHDKYGAAVDQLKKRLGLPVSETDKALGFLRNTVMAPFQCSELYVKALEKI